MNTLALQNQTSGPGPFLIRASDGKQYKAPRGEFAGVTRRHMMIENGAGAPDIVAPPHVVSIRPAARRRARAS